MVKNWRKREKEKKEKKEQKEMYRQIAVQGGRVNAINRDGKTFKKNAEREEAIKKDEARERERGIRITTLYFP